jgi:hypothetical protein
LLLLLLCFHLCCTCPDAPLTSHTTPDIHSPPVTLCKYTLAKSFIQIARIHNTRQSLIAHNTHCLDVLLPITTRPRPPAQTIADSRRQTTNAQCQSLSARITDGMCRISTCPTSRPLQMPQSTTHQRWCSVQLLPLPPRPARLETTLEHVRSPPLPVIRPASSLVSP